MVPGAAGPADEAQAAVDDGEMTRVEAIIDSMTPAERREPHVIRPAAAGGSQPAAGRPYRREPAPAPVRGDAEARPPARWSRRPLRRTGWLAATLRVADRHLLSEALSFPSVRLHVSPSWQPAGSHLTPNLRKEMHGCSHPADPSGCHQASAYRVIAIDSRRSRDGRALEILGYYNPLTDPSRSSSTTSGSSSDVAGARPSDAVQRLMKVASEPPRPAGAKAEAGEGEEREEGGGQGRGGQGSRGGAEAPKPGGRLRAGRGRGAEPYGRDHHERRSSRSGAG